MMTANPPDDILLSRLDQRLEEGGSLESEVTASLKHIPGSAKLVKKIRQEVKFLSKHREGDQRGLKAEHLECSNLTHLKAISQTLQKCHGLTDILKSFQFKRGDDGQKRKICVDAVCDGGSTWIKVVARNSKALELCSDGSQQFGQKSVVDQAEQFVECAKQNPYLFRTPTVKGGNIHMRDSR